MLPCYLEFMRFNHMMVSSKFVSSLIKKIDPSNNYPERILEKSIQSSPKLSSEDGINVQVTAQKNMLPFGPGPYKKNKDYIFISVNNLGPRTVIIEKAGLHQNTENKQFMIASDCLYYGPKRLEDGDRAEYLIEQDLVNIELIDYVWAMDKVGRIWKGSFAK